MVNDKIINAFFPPGIPGTPVFGPNVTEIEPSKFLLEWATPSFSNILEHSLIYKQVKVIYPFLNLEIVVSLLSIDCKTYFRINIFRTKALPLYLHTGKISSKFQTWSKQNSTVVGGLNLIGKGLTFCWINLSQVPDIKYG